MAEKNTKKSGTATANETWSDTLKPKTANSDICLVNGGFSLTWNSAEIIEAMTTEPGTTLTGSTAMSVGNANTPPSGFVLNLASGTASTFTGGFTLKGSTAGALKISIADAITTGLFVVETGKYELSRDLVIATLVGAATFRIKGSSALDAKSHNIETNHLGVLETSSLLGLTGTTVTIKASGGGEGLRVESSATLEGEPTINFTSTEPGGNGRQFGGGGKKYAALTVAAFVALEGSNTFGTLNVNKVKPGECKATLTAASNHLVVTSGEAALFVGAEVAGTAIPLGTTVVKKIEAGVWELSANASETVVVAETVTIYNPGVIVTQATTQTVTTLASNGTSGEPARMASSVAGKPWTLALPAGNHELTAVLRIKDLSVPEGAVLYVPNSTNLGGNNANVKFEAEPAGVIFGKATGTILLTGTATGTAISVISAKATGALLLTGTSTSIVRSVTAGKAAGAILLAGASTATVRSVVAAKATGTLLLTGTSKGSVAGAVQGKATGALTLTGTSKATIRAVLTGKATGTLLLTGTATGQRASRVTGTATGTLLFFGSAKGSISGSVTGKAIGALVFTGSAHAEPLIAPPHFPGLSEPRQISGLVKPGQLVGVTQGSENAGL